MAATYIAMTGIGAAQLNMETAASNLSNVLTRGYKNLGVQTTDLFYKQLTKAGTPEVAGDAPRPVGVEVGMGAKVKSTYRDLSMGELQFTNDPLNMAINGYGYFQVVLPNGNPAYTRNGSFTTRNGRLVTHDGLLLSDDIVIPDNVQTRVTISEGGVVSYKDNLGTTINLGQIQLYTFSDEQGLENIGNSLLIETDASGEAIGSVPGGEEGSGTIMQKYVEASNVKNYEELMNMMRALKLVQYCTQAMHIASKADDAILDYVSSAIS